MLFNIMLTALCAASTATVPATATYIILRFLLFSSGSSEIQKCHLHFSLISFTLNNSLCILSKQVLAFKQTLK